MNNMKTKKRYTIHLLDEKFKTKYYISKVIQNKSSKIVKLFHYEYTTDDSDAIKFTENKVKLIVRSISSFGKRIAIVDDNGDRFIYGYFSGYIGQSFR